MNENDGTTTSSPGSSPRTQRQVQPRCAGRDSYARDGSNAGREGLLERGDPRSLRHPTRPNRVGRRLRFVLAQGWAHDRYGRGHLFPLAAPYPRDGSPFGIALFHPPAR